MKYNAVITLVRGVGEWLLTMPAPTNDIINKFDGVKEWAVEIKTPRKRRSLSANAYCWVLCSKIAQAMIDDGMGFISDEEVYRKAVSESGAYFDIPVERERLDEFVKCWESNGIGWFCKRFDADNVSKVVEVRCYKGSSIYDRKEMSKLINYLIDECKQMGVEYRTQADIESMLDEHERLRNE